MNATARHSPDPAGDSLSRSKILTDRVVAALLHPPSTVRVCKADDLWDETTSGPRNMSGVFLLDFADSGEAAPGLWESLDGASLSGRRWDFTKKRDETCTVDGDPTPVKVRCFTYRLKIAGGSRQSCGFIREMYLLLNSSAAQEKRVVFIRQRPPRMYTYSNSKTPIPVVEQSVPQQLFTTEVFELTMQMPLYGDRAIATEWSRWWRDTESIDLWKQSSSHRQNWLSYLSQILYGLARWLFDQGGIKGQHVITELRLRIPAVYSFPKRFGLLEVDRVTIQSLVQFLESRAYVRLTLPKRYTEHFVGTVKIPHWSGATFEGGMYGTVAEGALRIRDHLYVGSFDQDCPHGKGQLYHLAGENSATNILWCFVGMFYYGMKQGRGEEWQRSDTGYVVTIGDWVNDVLSHEVYRGSWPAPRRQDVLLSTEPPPVSLPTPPTTLANPFPLSPIPSVLNINQIINPPEPGEAAGRSSAPHQHSSS